jgi:hypothetical protein
MDKKYQVFISSTFSDLEDERKEVMESILNLGCFPAGMEMFPASDDEQFDYIKTIIDESDYYVLIIAGRYGSLAQDGISYTEKEFDYAREKGVPTLVFIKKDIDSIPVNKTDRDSGKSEQLDKFREKAATNRVAKFWDNISELKYNVYDSLSKSFKTHPRTGWVRGNISNNTELLNQLNQLRLENDKLKEKVSNVESELKIDIENLATGNDITNIEYTTSEFMGETNYYSTQIAWGHLFNIFAPNILVPTNKEDAKKLLEQSLKEFINNKNTNFNVGENSFNKIKIQFQALGLINIFLNNTKQGGVECLELTDYGKKYLVNLKAERKK